MAVAGCSTWRLLADGERCRPRSWEALRGQMERQRLRLEELEGQAHVRRSQRRLRPADAARATTDTVEAAVTVTETPLSAPHPAWRSWLLKRPWRGDPAAKATPAESSGTAVSAAGRANGPAGGRAGGRAGGPGPDDRRAPPLGPLGMRSHLAVGAMLFTAFATGVLADNGLSALLAS